LIGQEDKPAGGGQDLFHFACMDNDRRLDDAIKRAVLCNKTGKGIGFQLVEGLFEQHGLPIKNSEFLQGIPDVDNEFSVQGL